MNETEWAILDNRLPGMLALAKGISEQAWPHTMDARVWVTKWLEVYRAYPAVATDEGALLGWFSNAIMAGYDTARSKANES